MANSNLGKAKAWLVIDGMWGSCGKGLLAGKLAIDREPDVVVCQYAPNAGHTFHLTPDSPPDMVQALPTGHVSPGLKHLLIGPGAAIDVDMLERELAARPQARETLRIHPHASVVTKLDKEMEAHGLKPIGSTMKGSASAYIRKVQRPAAPTMAGPTVAREEPRLRDYVVTVTEYDNIVRNARAIQVESSQGIELSLQRGYFWPYTTGRDITPESTLNDCGVPMRFLEETNVVIRPYPIRVGNVIEGGITVGTSGPVYPDMEELDWPTIAKRCGAPPTYQEITTVTKRVRRVFELSEKQLRHSLYVAGPSKVFLNFAEYLDESWNVRRAADLSLKGRAHLDRIWQIVYDAGSLINYLGWGKSYADVEEYSP